MSSKKSGKEKLALVKEICEKCGGKCCKLGGAEFTKSDRDRVLSAGHPNYFRKLSSDHYETKTKEGVCAYLTKENLCSIQELKPKMCWAWPVSLDYKKHKKVFELMLCPLTPYITEKEIKLMKEQISGYEEDIIFGNFSKMKDNEVKKVMNRYYKYKKKILE